VDQTIEDLRRRSGKEIWLFGGGQLFRGLLERGHVDVVEVGLIPVLLGRGIPFLPGLAHRVELRLTSTERYPTGLLLLTYAIAR
jgi:dihydrofolate reductase